MKITASVKNSNRAHDVQLSTNGNTKTLTIAPKEGGPGSSVNGGELLFLSLATCYCNDIYREAARRKMSITDVEVFVEGHFGAEGEPASDITYRVKISSDATDDEIKDLLQKVDEVAEVHNTLRRGVEVKLVRD